jgi:DNA-binding response OmpR family regulator
MKTTFHEIILIGDADAIMRPLFDLLSARGHESVRYFARLQSSVPILANHRRTLVIIDLDAHSPFAVLQAISNSSPGADVDVIGLTGTPSQGLIQFAIKSGIAAILTKPVSPKQLLDRIERLSRREVF